MNIYATIPETWKPNDTEAINEWFLKINGEKTKKDWKRFLTELDNAIKN